MRRQRQRLELGSLEPSQGMRVATRSWQRQGRVSPRAFGGNTVSLAHLCYLCIYNVFMTWGGILLLQSKHDFSPSS